MNLSTKYGVDGNKSGTFARLTTESGNVEMSCKDFVFKRQHELFRPATRVK